MTMRFLDLHVHSSQSTGVDTREELEGFSNFLGTQIRFCDDAAGDGVEIASASKADFKRRPAKAPYLILRPLSNESAVAAVRVKNAILNMALTPTLAKSMHKNRCSTEICLSAILGSSGISRIKAIKGIRKNMKYARKYNVPIVVTSGAKSVYGLRSPHQTYELLRTLGLTDEEVKEGMFGTPLSILKSGMDRVEGRLISAEVRVV